MIANLLYGIPILAQNCGLIEESNVKDIEVSVIRLKLFLISSNSFCFFYPLKSALRIFKIAEIAIWCSNIGPILGSDNRE